MKKRFVSQYENQYNEMLRALKIKVVDAEKKNGKIWNIDKKATDFVAKGETEEQARRNLLNQIKDLAGVSVVYGSNGVKFVQIKTAYKSYNCSIHAYHTYDGIYAKLFLGMGYWREENDYDYSLFPEDKKAVDEIGDKVAEDLRNYYLGK